MAQYIDKSALVAEIERMMNRYDSEYDEDSTEVKAAKGNVCHEILCTIDNLEVKEVDLEKDVRKIISLYYEGIMYYEDVIKKEREENGGSDLAIKIMDGVVDARELNTLYVIDKLKAQKGE